MYGITQFGLLGLVLGGVGGYIMGWLAPALPNWPLRFIHAAIFGGLLSALAAPGLYVLAMANIAFVGVVAALMAAFMVSRAESRI